MANAGTPELREKIVSESSANEPESESYIGTSSGGGEIVEDEEHRSMMNSMSGRIGMFSDTLNQWSIFRVPSWLRELNKDAYTPRIVSIGPIHSGQQNLQAMEVYKTWYMDSLFKRTKDYKQTFSACIRAILNIKQIAPRYYYDYQNLFLKDTRLLAEILLVDGCFILELLIRRKSTVNYKEISGDPMFAAGTICSLQRDLALLENQIPFVVLEGLFEIIKTNLDRQKAYRYDPNSLKNPNELPSLNQLVDSFFNLGNLNQISSDCRHLLDHIRNSYLPMANSNVGSTSCLIDITEQQPNQTERTEQQPDQTEQQPNQRWEWIHCVTKLRESGIKFVMGKSQNLFHIEFFPDGVLKIPNLCINDTMDSRLRNMIAFEQCCLGIDHYITSYAVLMDCLIDSPVDAEFLHHKGIIKNYLGDGEEVSNIFNKISKKVFVKDFYFAATCKQVNQFCNLCWPKKREIFVRNYYSNPWKFIGVIAGSIILVFTGLQTAYSMASYHHPPK